MIVFDWLARGSGWLTPQQWAFGTATLTAALALWLLLPRGTRRGRRAGIALGLVSLATFAAVTMRLGDPAGEVVFGLLSAVTLVSAVATVTSRDPVYAAIWFALVLLGTAGLFLCQGAQFLGLATVVVYAGAILVTFLFVLMLAQPEGHAFYDRISWEALLSAATGAVLVGMLAMSISAALHGVPVVRLPAAAAGTTSAPLQEIALHETALAENILAPDHVSRLGSRLFSRHLVAVEVAGALLLAALVGAVAMVLESHRSPRRAGAASTGESANGRDTGGPRDA